MRSIPGTLHVKTIAVFLVFVAVWMTSTANVAAVPCLDDRPYATEQHEESDVLAPHKVIVSADRTETSIPDEARYVPTQASRIICRTYRGPPESSLL